MWSKICLNTPERNWETNRKKTRCINLLLENATLIRRTRKKNVIKRWKFLVKLKYIKPCFKVLKKEWKTNHPRQQFLRLEKIFAKNWNTKWYRRPTDPYDSQDEYGYVERKYVPRCFGNHQLGKPCVDVGVYGRDYGFYIYGPPCAHIPTTIIQRTWKRYCKFKKDEIFFRGHLIISSRWYAMRPEYYYIYVAKVIIERLLNNDLWRVIERFLV